MKIFYLFLISCVSSQELQQARSLPVGTPSPECSYLKTIESIGETSSTSLENLKLKALRSKGNFIEIIDQSTRFVGYTSNNYTYPSFESKCDDSKHVEKNFKDYKGFNDYMSKKDSIYCNSSYNNTYKKIHSIPVYEFFYKAKIYSCNL